MVSIYRKRKDNSIGQFASLCNVLQSVGAHASAISRGKVALNAIFLCLFGGKPLMTIMLAKTSFGCGFRLIIVPFGAFIE
ncbi:hypothetical protein TH25_09550 [Thalassospira profundimaris]|uniref:Uncharacterized protein n=1 Tax=Thalassospira profundimaris TaxID=502049 RepID=A0A367XEY5_9PROT|nr:hypothetical protein TH25_09550 [Thalassospira profundimaris]